MLVFCMVGRYDIVNEGIAISFNRETKIAEAAAYAVSHMRFHKNELIKLFGASVTSKLLKQMADYLTPKNEGYYVTKNVTSDIEMCLCKWVRGDSAYLDKILSESPILPWYSSNWVSDLRFVMNMVYDHKDNPAAILEKYTEDDVPYATLCKLFELIYNPDSIKEDSTLGTPAPETRYAMRVSCLSEIIELLNRLAYPHAVYTIKFTAKSDVKRHSDYKKVKAALKQAPGTWYWQSSGSRIRILVAGVTMSEELVLALLHSIVKEKHMEVVRNGGE